MIGDLVIEMVFQLRLMDCYGRLVGRSTVPGTDSPVGVGTGRCVALVLRQGGDTAFTRKRPDAGCRCPARW